MSLKSLLVRLRLLFTDFKPNAGHFTTDEVFIVFEVRVTPALGSSSHGFAGLELLLQRWP